MKAFIQILLLLYSINSWAQYNWDSKNWNMESLGFACSVSGEMTKPVLNMTHMLIEKRFDEIRRLLNSNVPADQFLATFTMERLAVKQDLEITEDEHKKITEIKNSDVMVPFCSGCTLWIEIPLKDLFGTKKEIVSANADNWFDRYYGIYYKKKKKRYRDN